MRGATRAAMAEPVAYEPVKNTPDIPASSRAAPTAGPPIRGVNTASGTPAFMHQLGDS